MRRWLAGEDEAAVGILDGSDDGLAGKVGFFEFNRNPENFFAEVEQSAFNPAQVVPGISFSPDKMLQARLFSYGDAQRYRLGVNHHQIPVNAPRCPVHSYHRDGAMRVAGNKGATLGYEPNSYGEWKEQPDFREPPLSIDGVADHWNHREDGDYCSQPGALFRLMTPAQRQVLFENTARSVGGAPSGNHRGKTSCVTSGIACKLIRLMATAWQKHWALPTRSGRRPNKRQAGHPRHRRVRTAVSG